MNKIFNYTEFEMIREGKFRLYYDKVKDMEPFELIRQLHIIRSKNRSDQFSQMLVGLIKDKTGWDGKKINDLVLNVSM